VCGQNSDGYGEGFEQRPIKTPDGEIYVSFWDSGNYSMMLLCIDSVTNIHNDCVFLLYYKMPLYIQKLTDMHDR